MTPSCTQDAADLNVRGIPLGELVSLSPRQVAVLAVTGELPSESVGRAFDARLRAATEKEGALQDLAAALDELDACERDICLAAAAGQSSFVAELTRCYFAMTLWTANLDTVAGKLEPPRELTEAADWITRLAAAIGEGSPEPVVVAAAGHSSVTWIRVPGFGHPLLRGLDPRFVAIHAIVVRCCASDVRVGAMQAAIRWIPQIAHLATSAAHECMLANLYLPLGVGLTAAGLEPRAHAQRLVAASAAAQVATERASRHAWMTGVGQGDLNRRPLRGS